MPAGDRIRVGILGITGHTGEELLRWLLRHPRVEVSLVASRGAGQKLSTIYPWSGLDLEVEEIDVGSIRERCDCVFLALPHTVSQQFVPGLVGGPVVIDLSADFRFREAEVYERWYRVRHSCPDLLKKAVYGLPELRREEIKKASLVANPGCYPTAVILGLYPFVKNFSFRSIWVDAKSGTSGAGRKIREELLFVSMANNLYPYKPNTHQHIPEILSQLGIEAENFVFVPHIVGIDRGIVASIYVETDKRLDPEEVKEAYESFYANSPFVVVRQDLPSYLDVRNTNQCHIAIRLLAPRKLLIVSTIDNLVKGASGQAIQNMNLIFGLEEKEGLR